MLDAALSTFRPGLEPVHYLVTQKNRHHGEAIAKGFGARTVPAGGGGATFRNAPQGGVLHLVGGLQFGSLDILADVRSEGWPYVFFDRAYFGGGPGTDRLRATRNAYQQHWVDVKAFDADGGRARWWGVALKPWRVRGHHILVVPPSPEVCRLFGLGDWEAYTLARLRLATDRPLVVSYKGDPKPLSIRLEGCHAVVTPTSNVAVEAVCAGVPAFVGPESAALPVATPLAELERYIEAPLMPDREAWAASLAWGQFTLEEIRRGFAKEVLFA